MIGHFIKFHLRQTTLHLQLQLELDVLLQVCNLRSDWNVCLSCHEAKKNVRLGTKGKDCLSCEQATWMHTLKTAKLRLTGVKILRDIVEAVRTQLMVALRLLAELGRGFRLNCLNAPMIKP